MAQSPAIGQERHLIFHDIKVDPSGKINPWYSDDPAIAYDFAINAVWTYWKNVPHHWVRSRQQRDKSTWYKELKFPPKYLIFRTLEDKGIGGDQFAMMLSSWDLYYNYSGNNEVLQNMIFQADWYLKYGLSKPDAAWPNIPYPCNTEEAPVYDGDLILGKGWTQPDKAGSFGVELLMLFKKTNQQQYLDAAIKIANTLSAHTQAGDYDNSPLPFKVHAETGEVKTTYTTNWTGTLRLLQGLIQLGQGEVNSYQRSFQLISDWLKMYPIKNNRWGPFFEDITTWSDTEINEGTMALYLLEYPEWSSTWKRDVRSIQDWAIKTLGIDHWKQYGCTVMGEQSVYKMQGQSHTARHASIELMYANLSGDNSRVEEAIRQLNFSTYAVDNDGKCVWMNFDTYEIWWTDGYGDFVRHFIRAMAAHPELAPGNSNHILESTSVIQNVKYTRDEIQYQTFDGQSEEVIRTTSKPKSVFCDGKKLKEGASVGFSWKRLKVGGVVRIQKTEGKSVTIKL